MKGCCQRETGSKKLVEVPRKNPYTRRPELATVLYQPRCYGPLRTLYVRVIEQGEAKGWQAVGSVCLDCHEVRLDEERLPTNPYRLKDKKAPGT